MRDVGALAGAVAHHRRQRHDAGAAGDEQERPPVLRPPREPAADRAAQLDLVAVRSVLAQVAGHLAVGQHLDRQLDALVVGRCRDRVAALGLVAVLGGQADVDVLAGAMAGPVGDVDDEGVGASASPGGARPAGPRATGSRGTAAMSVPRVPLLAPGVAALVVAELLPEPEVVLDRQREPPDPLRALPEVQVRHQEPGGTAVLGIAAARPRRCRRPTPCRRSRRPAAGSWCSRRRSTR